MAKTEVTSGLMINLHFLKDACTMHNFSFIHMPLKFGENVIIWLSNIHKLIWSLKAAFNLYVQSKQKSVPIRSVNCISCGGLKFFSRFAEEVERWVNIFMVCTDHNMVIPFVIGP